ncbi:MAG: glycoside hydrolase family 3 protein [Bacteroidales bacterium]|nr:glycoside hydrolase family 3 protein [Bacteroidales bacterium]
MKRGIIALAIAIGILTVGCQGQQAGVADEDIGEMLLVGFRGTTIDSTHHIWRDIVDYHVGSVILFDYDVPSGRRGRNITGKEQLLRLCKQLHRVQPQLLIGIDQEGGKVNRLHTRYGFPPIASAKHSRVGGKDSVEACAKQTAMLLKGSGINLNFAPVADVDINPQCPVIGKLERSFSENSDTVAECCRIWIDEQHKMGIASCLKHFPGHGSARGDTHKGLVDVSETWERQELEPYFQLAKEVPMVMTAHVINRQLDASGLPASLSVRITSLLRDTIGFAGVIVTDDLAMGAIVQEYTFEEALRLAIVAGADMLCLSNNGSEYDTELVAKAVEVIRRLVATGAVSAERIHQSAERVRQLKASLR